MNIFWTTDTPWDEILKRITCAFSLLKSKQWRKNQNLRQQQWRKKNSVTFRIYNADYQHKRRRKIAAMEGRTIIPPRDQSLVTPEQRKRELKENYARYKARHPERCREQQRRWKRNNRVKVETYRRNKFKTDVQWNIAGKVRRAIGGAFRRSNIGRRDRNRSIMLLGCSFNELHAHLEKQFRPGMTWEAVLSSKIHLDHIRPINSFDLTDENQKQECFHYSNLQPLWALDNMRKHDKHDYVPSHQPA